MLADRVGVMSARPGHFIETLTTGWPRDPRFAHFLRSAVRRADGTTVVKPARGVDAAMRGEGTRARRIDDRKAPHTFICWLQSAQRARWLTRPAARSVCSGKASWSQTGEIMRATVAMALGIIVNLQSFSSAAENLKVAVAQRGFWNSSFVEFAERKGFFKDAGLIIEVIYTDGGATTLAPAISGSAMSQCQTGSLG